MLAESAFGRNSSQLSFIRSLFTDQIAVTNTLTTSALQTEIEFESGVGTVVRMELVCSDLSLEWKQEKAFGTNLVFEFDNLIPGSSYSWTILATSRGSIPLHRTYNFTDSSVPIAPVSLVQAASTLESYDTFVFTVGSEQMNERSTKSIQMKWAQERRIDGYNITDVTLNRQVTHVIAESGWALHDITELNSGRKYTYQVVSISHGLSSNDVMVIKDSTHPLPPNENITARIVGDNDITLDIQYFDIVQNLKVSLIPPEGNCASVCTFDAPSTTSVQLTGLTPGQDYNISLVTVSHGKESDPILITEQLQPGQILHFLHVVSSKTVTVELQLGSAAGSQITLDFYGIYSGHAGSKKFPYKLVSRLVLEDLRPSESYNMTLTLKGLGVNPKIRVKTFEAHLYPSDIVISNVQANVHDLSMVYQTEGEFSFIEISVSPPGTECPCLILNQDQSTLVTTVILPGSQCPCRVLYQGETGQIIIGDPNTHPLTAGEEYYITLRSSSFYGLQSSPTLLVKSLPTDQIIRTNNRIVATTALFASFEFEIESGVGSYVHLKLSNFGIDDFVIEEVNQQFSLITQKSVPVFHGMCVKLDAYIYSKGSDPHEEYVQFIVVVPPIPLSALPSGQTKFSLEYRHSDLQRWFQFIFYINENFETLHVVITKASGEHFIDFVETIQVLNTFNRHYSGDNSYWKQSTMSQVPAMSTVMKAELYMVLCGLRTETLHLETSVVPIP
ncbi:uncharacterized protein LOC142337153 [Convolutriloba macropyga]|uniref:uncharacterized protein LOC142337153 n=1 Tax=Convolutriloba macropyga TaxID=536237 RepID=UPI003F523780